MYTKSTNKELVEELTLLNTEGKYDKIIARAKKNDYHDFKSDPDSDSIGPKMDLVNDLVEFPELEEIRNAVMNGDYDEAPDAEDAEQLKKDFPFIDFPAMFAEASKKK